MLGIAVVLIVAASPGAPIQRLAAMGLEAVNLDAKAADALSSHFAQQLNQRGFKVVTAQEVSAVIGLERQKQLLGCTEATVCSAELAGALGVDAIITGTVSKTTAGYLINLKILSSTDASVIAGYSARPRTDEALLDFLEESAAKFAASHGRTEPAAVATSTAPVPSGASPGPAAWVVGAVGVAGLAAGGAFLVAANVTGGQLARGEAASEAGLLDLRRTGQTEEVLGWVGLSVGAAALATSVVLFIVRPARAAPASVSLVATPNGTLLTVGGTF